MHADVACSGRISDQAPFLSLCGLTRSLASLLTPLLRSLLLAQAMPGRLWKEASSTWVSF